MKKALLVLCALIAGLQLAGAQVKGTAGTIGTYWTLGMYDGGLDTLQTDMNDKIKSGLVPVAFEMSSGKGLTVMYLRSFSKTTPKARLDQSTTANLSANLNALLKAGWLPQDVCFRGTDVYVLSLEDAGAAVNVSGAIHSVAVDETTLAAQVTTLAKTGYVPFGISEDKGKIWIFSLIDKRNPFTKVSVTVYPNDGSSMFTGVDRLIKDQYQPVGYCSTDKGIFVLSLK